MDNAPLAAEERVLRPYTLYNYIYRPRPRMLIYPAAPASVPRRQYFV